MPNKLLTFNTKLQRMDLSRPITYVLLFLLAIAWTLTGPAATMYEYLLHFLAAGFFVMVVRAVVRLGASRLSSLIAAAVALALCWQFTPAQLAETATFGALIVAGAEYFKHPTKTRAVLFGVFAGILAAGIQDKAATILLLFFGLIIVRLKWHVLLERLSKKQLALFVIKAVVAGGIAVGVFLAAARFIEFPWATSAFITAPEVHAAALILILLVSLRGLWATLLLKTARSPQLRPLRLYFVAFSAALVLLVCVLQRFGDRVFLPEAMDWLTNAGLTSFNLEIMAVVFYTIALLFTAGIDRSLHRSAPIAHRLLQSNARKSSNAKTN